MRIRMTTVPADPLSSNPKPIREPNTRLGGFMLQWLALLAPRADLWHAPCRRCGSRVEIIPCDRATQMSCAQGNAASLARHLDEHEEQHLHLRCIGCGVEGMASMKVYGLAKEAAKA